MSNSYLKFNLTLLLKLYRDTQIQGDLTDDKVDNLVNLHADLIENYFRKHPEELKEITH